GQVGAGRQVLDAEGFEALEVGLPGRQVRGSGRREVSAVELEEDPLLPAKVTERNVAPEGTRQAKVGRRLADLCRSSRTDSDRNNRQRHQNPAECSSSDLHAYLLASILRDNVRSEEHTSE